MTMTSKILNIGFIGNGKSVNRYHAPFILSRKDLFKIKKIYTVDRSKDAWEDIEGVEYTEDLNSLLNDKDIDVIIVSTPSRFHAEYAKKAIEAGKNCVVEKPFTQQVADAIELFELAKEKGVLLEGYQNRRFDSDFLTLQKVIQSGKLGELLEIESHYDYYRPHVPESVTSYSRDASFVFNHACHTIDQIISLFGSPDKVVYDVRQILGIHRGNDYFDIDMFYGGLKVSVKSSFFRVKPRDKFVAYGKKGAFFKHTEDRQEFDLKHFYMPTNSDFGVDRVEDYGTLIYYDDEGIYHEEKVVSERGSYTYYYEALYDTIVNGAEPLVKPEQTLKLMEIMDEAVQEIERRENANN